MLISYGAQRQRPLKELVWRHPEWWMVTLSAAAWVGLAVRATTGHVHANRAIDSWMHWVLMVVAMMLPLTIGAIRTTACRSLWHRRHRAVLGFLLGYCGVWALLGLPLAWMAFAFDLPERLNWAAGAAIGFLLAAGWMVSPWKLRAARMCHRTIPLAPRGWKADRDCLCYGWTSGLYCAANCWPFMLVCWLSAHSFVAMSCGFGFGWAERYRRPDYRFHALILAGMAAVFAVYALTGFPPLL